MSYIIIKRDNRRGKEINLDIKCSLLLYLKKQSANHSNAEKLLENDSSNYGITVEPFRAQRYIENARASHGNVHM